MGKRFLLLCFIFPATAGIVEGQFVHQVEYESQADILLYYVGYGSSADAILYYSDYQSQVRQEICNGVWFVTKYRSQADFTFAVTEFRSSADILVYPADFRSQTTVNQSACAKLHSVNRQGN